MTNIEPLGPYVTVVRLRITHAPAVHCAPPDAPPLVTLQPCAEHLCERTFDKYFFELPGQGLLPVDSYALLAVCQPGQWMLTFADGCVAHVSRYEFRMSGHGARPPLIACETALGTLFLSNNDAETHLFHTRYENRALLCTPPRSPAPHQQSAPNTPDLVS